MAQDKYTAVWVSHSSISDFIQCPRAYFLKNVYRDPKTNHKIKLINPPLALGQIVHEVVEALSVLPVDKRFDLSLIERLDEIWPKITGKKGGFVNSTIEARYKDRAKAMLRRVTKHPGPIAKKAVKIKMDLPYFWLSEEDNIILCGKIDWLEYLAKTDSVHIIDFKTGKGKEKPSSLQLPIYHLLVSFCQERQATKASYWYLEHNDELTSKALPDLDEAYERVLSIAKKIKLARQLERFECSHKNGCQACEPFEAILRGEGELVGADSYNNNVYILDKTVASGKKESVIL